MRLYLIFRVCLPHPAFLSADMHGGVLVFSADAGIADFHAAIYETDICDNASPDSLAFGFRLKTYPL
jgi:hypothetical protein